MSDVAAPALALNIARRFAAPPQRVFDAWLTPAWAKWLPPGGATCHAVEMDARVGGRYDLSMTMPDGRIVTIHGVYREIVPAQKLVLTWHGSYNSEETIIAVTFVADGDGTLMTLEQTGFHETEFRDRHNSGWNGPGGSFDKLAGVLAD